MGLPAAERTAEISTAPVSRVGRKEDAAVPAAGQEGPQARFGLQNGPQDEIVLQDQIAYPRFPVPVRAELEMFLELYGKEARVSLMMLMYDSLMPLSYHTASTTSRGMARALFFPPFLVLFNPAQFRRTAPQLPFVVREDVCRTCLITRPPRGYAS